MLQVDFVLTVLFFAYLLAAMAIVGGWAALAVRDLVRTRTRVDSLTAASAAAVVAEPHNC